MSNVSLLPIFRRAEFQGRTDKYAPMAQEPRLFENVVGTLPENVAGSVLSDRFTTDYQSRIAGYTRYWNFYAGRHFIQDYEGGDRKVPFNYCRAIVQKRASWIAGKGFSFNSVKGNELVADVFRKIWKANGGQALIRKAAKASLTTGDAFLYFTLKTTQRGKKLPQDKWRVLIKQINPSFCLPVYSEEDPGEMAAFLMQFPVWGPKGQANSRVFTAVMTPDSIAFYMDSEEVSTLVNPLGVIPVVHVACDPVADATFGTSILEDIIPLNERYNALAHSISRIIKYHGEPTTLVFGARLSTMERGANKVWSNLPPPKECDVRNLEMAGDLGAYTEYQKEIESHIYRLGRTPKFCFDPEGLSISNTSGMAMQMHFQPLIEATIEGQDQFEGAIIQGNRIIAAIHESVLKEPLSILADEPESFLDIDVSWKSLLPKDEQLEMDLIDKKVALGIMSKAEAMRRVSGVTDTEKLALELAADARYDIATVAEKQRALEGQAPCFSAVTLSSIFLNEDLLDVATKIKDLDADNGNNRTNRDTEG